MWEANDDKRKIVFDELDRGGRHKSAGWGVKEMAVVCKVVLRYREEEEALWREVIVSKYGEDECLKNF